MEKIVIACLLSMPLHAMHLERPSLEPSNDKINQSQHILVNPENYSPIDFANALKLMVWAGKEFILPQKALTLKELDGLLVYARTIEMAQFLIKHGASIQRLSLQDLESPLHSSILGNGQPGILAFYRNNGLSIFDKNAQGNTLLHLLAMRAGHECRLRETLHDLLAGLIPREMIDLYEMKNNKGETPLYIMKRLDSRGAFPYGKKRINNNIEILQQTYDNAAIVETLFAFFEDRSHANFLQWLPQELRKQLKVNYSATIIENIKTEEKIPESSFYHIFTTSLLNFVESSYDY